MPMATHNHGKSAMHIQAWKIEWCETVDPHSIAMYIASHTASQCAASNVHRVISLLSQNFVDFFIPFQTAP